MIASLLHRARSLFGPIALATCVVAAGPNTGESVIRAITLHKLRLNVRFEGELVARQIELRVLDQAGVVVLERTITRAELDALELRVLGVRKPGRYRLELRDDRDRRGHVELEVSRESGKLVVTAETVVTMKSPPETTSPPSSELRDREDMKWQRLYFSTDRARQPRETRLEDRFGREGDPEEHLSHGIAMVSFPPGHVPGRIERPALWKFEVSVDPEKHVALQSLAVLPSGDFFTALDEELRNRDGLLLITIHGFNVDFGDAVRLGAQFAHDLSPGCASYLFTWPSRGGVEDYLADERSNEWSREHFAAVLDTIVRLPSLRRIMVVAHSMGARIASEGLLKLQECGRLSDSPLVSELVLAAADMDAPLFKQKWPRLRRAVGRTTVYCSSMDKAIMASRGVHKETRVGDGGARALLLDGLTTIEASDSRMDMFGHGFFANDSSIIKSLGGLLAGQPTDAICCSRPSCCMTRVSRDGQSYWRYEEK